MPVRRPRFRGSREDFPDLGFYSAVPSRGTRAERVRVRVRVNEYVHEHEHAYEHEGRVRVRARVWSFRTRALTRPRSHVLVLVLVHVLAPRTRSRQRSTLQNSALVTPSAQVECVGKLWTVLTRRHLPVAGRVPKRRKASPPPPLRFEAIARENRNGEPARVSHVVSASRDSLMVPAVVDVEHQRCVGTYRGV